MDYSIRTGRPEDIDILTEVIRVSFRDVAGRFGLTSDNCPKHPSNCTVEWVRRDMDRGVVYCILDEENGAAGCVALERAEGGEWYLERLAVLPDRRRRGLGRALVEHVLAQAQRSGAVRVGIGIIAGDTDLKRWYREIGFVEGETKVFAHLPFRVTFMSYQIGGSG
ncbi:MAG: GNAT family N-acetyltransferase [Deltaproteobacteria bacterium]|nr:GNAT family N-acetyltransferase [Deltaproteobacteria bacterium]